MAVVVTMARAEQEAEVILLLDQDGPLADFDRHLFDVASRHGWNIDCTHDTQRHRFLTDHCDRASAASMRDYVHARGFFARLPVTPGAAEGVERLLADGVDIWVCTKPLEANPTCLNDKHAWLVHHFPSLEHHLITTPDKSMIRGDVLYDDAIKTEWVANADWKPVVFDTVWNRRDPWAGLHRCSWADVIEHGAAAFDG